MIRSKVVSRKTDSSDEFPREDLEAFVQAELSPLHRYNKIHPDLQHAPETNERCNAVFRKKHQKRSIE